MIRVAIVDDHAIVRAGLRQFLSEDPALRIVAECATARDAQDAVRQGGIDVVLLDLAMPDQNGIDVLQAMKASAPEVAVLIFSSFPEEHYALTLLRLGASGYLSKDCEPEALLNAIHVVARGRRYITPRVADQLAANLMQPERRDPHELLSEREFQVFLHLAQGKTITQLAAAMALSVKTVSTYRTRVMEKLHLTSNSDLTYYALKHGLIQ